VTDVAATDGGFVVTTDDGDHEADYLVLATGADRSLADALGCAFDDDIVDVDVTMETSVDDASATGAMVRAEEWQAGHLRRRRRRRGAEHPLEDGRRAVPRLRHAG
jgi:thioredoxin reductase